MNYRKLQGSLSRAVKASVGVEELDRLIGQVIDPDAFSFKDVDFSEDDLTALIDAWDQKRPERLFVQDGFWFRASSYTFDRQGWIKPAKGSEDMFYSLKGSEELIVEDLAALGREVAQERGGIFKIIPPRLRDNLVSFYDKHGPLGLAFAGVYGMGLDYTTGDEVVYLDPLRRQHSPAVDHFRAHLPRPESCFTARGFDVNRFAANYREHSLQAAVALAGFSVAYGAFKGQDKKLISAYFDKPLKSALPGLEINDMGRLLITWKPSNLLNVAYLHILTRQIGGPAGRVCANSNCDNFFYPTRKNNIYCSDTCSALTRKHRQRGKL